MADELPDYVCGNCRERKSKHVAVAEPIYARTVLGHRTATNDPAGIAAEASAAGQRLLCPTALYKGPQA